MYGGYGEMSEAKKGNKVLLYYNAYSGSGVFKNNLDYIVERCQEEGFPGGVHGPRVEGRC